MKIKTLIPLVLVSLVAAPALALADGQTGRQADNHGDNRGVMLEQRFAQQAQQARENGNDELAKRLQQRGDAIAQRMNRLGDRINQRMAKRGEHIQPNRMNHQQRNK